MFHSMKIEREEKESKKDKKGKRDKKNKRDNTRKTKERPSSLYCTYATNQVLIKGNSSIHVLMKFSIEKFSRKVQLILKIFENTFVNLYP